MNSDRECVTMDSENQLCRDQKGNCRTHGSRWRYKCYKVSCQNSTVKIINASKIETYWRTGRFDDFEKKKTIKLTVDRIIIFFLTECCVKDSKGDFFFLQVINVTCPCICNKSQYNHIMMRTSVTIILLDNLLFSMGANCYYRMIRVSVTNIHLFYIYRT